MSLVRPSALLFGALLFASAGTFTSCKDYDDDINNLQEQINTIASSLEDLKAQIGTKGVTSVKVEGGQLIVVTDGQSVTYDLPSGVDVEEIEIKDGHLYVGGVDKGAIGGTGSVVTVNEDGVLMIDGKEAGLKVGTEVIIKDASNGVYTISINGETIQLPMASSALVGIQDVKDENENNYQIFYGLLTNAVDWDGAKATNGKMVAGMYPVLDRDVKVMLNPTGVDATDYNFEFRASDNVALWGLKFGDMEPYAGEKLTRAASESGIWVLPREIDRVDLNELNERADYITQFKENDGNSYAFALMATAKDDASQVVKSQYVYSFDPKNIGDMDAKDFKWNQLKNNYKWGTFHTPDFEDYSWNNSGAVGDIDLPVYLSQVIYDYKLEIDKTKMSQVDIDKYGLQVSEDGYTFAATKEAAVDNDVYFKLSYILVNGSKYTTTYKVRITANDIVTENKQIGTINEAFNATYMTNSLISQLNDRYVLSAQEIKFSPKEVLGANYDEWIDAMYKRLQYVTSDDVKADILKENATVIGGDPINNDQRYNNALLQNFIYLDYVDANGKSCVYDVDSKDLLSRLGDIAALKVYFIAATFENIDYNNDKGTYVDPLNGNYKPVSAPYYTLNRNDWREGIAMPLNNAFTVEVGTAKEEQIVAKYSFKFQLTMPECPVTRVKSTTADKSVLWSKLKDSDNKEWELLKVYGEKNATENKIMGDLRDAFTGIFNISGTKYEVTPEASYYTLTTAVVDANEQLIGGANGDLVTLAGISAVSEWSAWNTWDGSFVDNHFTANDEGYDMLADNIVYNHFGVYPENLDKFYVQFASKIEDSQKPTYKTVSGQTGNGEEKTPLMAQTVYKNDKVTLDYYKVTINDANFILKDAFGDTYKLFDAKDSKGNITKRNVLNNMWANDREGIDDKAIWYGLNPKAEIDGTNAGNKVWFHDPSTSAPNASTGATEMTIYISPEVAAAKNNLVKVTLQITDVFGHTYDLPIYIQTVK